VNGPSTPLPLTEAPTATAADGFVLLDHPAGLAITLTADVAVETGERLIAAAEEASTQRRAGEPGPD
jgi:hypothetical protein